MPEPNVMKVIRLFRWNGSEPIYISALILVANYSTSPVKSSVLVYLMNHMARLFIPETSY